MPYLSHELVATQILLRLPIKSLLRFRCVCKAWHDTVAGDFFRRAHLRRQSVSLLIAPQIAYKKESFGWSTEVRTPGLYQWEESQPDDATLVHCMSDHESFFPFAGLAHDLAHCDGLILVPTDAKVRVINPATRRTLMLPHNLRPRAGLPVGYKGHQAFGLGHDPRSNTYKVARFFHNFLECKISVDHRSYTLGMEVYTIGATDQHQHWRLTSTPPPYPIIPGRTATYYKGSLLWTIQESVLGDTSVAPGFVRFRLEDESFIVTPPPPCHHRIDYAASSLAELRGELCVCVPKSEPDMESYEMWMCDDLDEVPQWNLRHVITGIKVFAGVRFLRPVVAYADAIVLQEGARHLCRFDTKTQQISVNLYIEDLRYHQHDTGRLFEYRMKNLYCSSLVPYNPSVVPV